MSLLLKGRTLSGPISAHATIDGKSWLSFHGAGYLALADLPEVRDAVRRALDAGAPFARQLPASTGALDLAFDAVEREGAKALGTSASVYVASGYLIGAVAMAAFAQDDHVLFIDETAHHNLRDAAAIRRLPTYEFAHCDADALRDAIAKNLKPGQRPIVLTDGIFPTVGRMPPLSSYEEVLAPYDGRLVVDESHSFGVVGNNGRGAAELCGVEPIAHVGATLSKAFCAQGALVACSTEDADRLRHMPPVRGACSGSPLSAVAAAAALKVVRDRPMMRQWLAEITTYLRTELRALGITCVDSPAPIVAFQYGDEREMVALQHHLFQRHIYIQHSTYIGAGAGGVLRCALFHNHQRGDVDRLISAIRGYGGARL